MLSSVFGEGNASTDTQPAAESGEFGTLFGAATGMFGDNKG
jgi:hypothetical protein